MERLPEIPVLVRGGGTRQHQRSFSDTQDLVSNQYNESRPSSTGSSDSGILRNTSSQPSSPKSPKDPKMATMTPIMPRKISAFLKLQHQKSVQHLILDPQNPHVAHINTPTTPQLDNFSVNSGLVNGETFVSFDAHSASPRHSDGISFARENSMASVSTIHVDPPPTDPKQKDAWFLRVLSENMSIVYAIFLVSLGIVIYMADIFAGPNYVIAEVYNLFLAVTQLAWLLATHIDTRVFIHTVKRKVEEARSRNGEKEDKIFIHRANDGECLLRFDLRNEGNSIPLHYGFSSEGSIYIKIGATVFCFGHMIHTGLTFGQQVLYSIDKDPILADCFSPVNAVFSALQPICAFYQLFFIFKYANLIINRRLILARFGLMHSIGASLCYWIYTILQETLQAVFAKQKYDDGPTNTSGDYVGNEYYASTTWEIEYGCAKDTYLSSMVNSTGPYLYPFSIEFYILMVGLWMFLRENLGRVESHTHIPSIEVTYEDTNQKSLTSNLVIAVDCHSSSRGLFLGLLVTAASVLSIILLFILSASEDTSNAAVIVNGVTEVVIIALMLVASVVVFRFVWTMDVIKNFHSNVDDILLYMTLPCIFLYAFLRIVPAAMNNDGLFIAVSILQVLQVITQTALIHDGLRRRSNSPELRRKKPGRETLTFLIVTNVALWLLQTFEIKSEESNSTLYAFYGKELWTLLAHLTLPFALFYRFHSSVCLADMWKECYEEDHTH